MKKQQEEKVGTNYELGGVYITSKSLRVHSAISSLSLTKISVPTSRDVHILLAGREPGSCKRKECIPFNQIHCIFFGSSNLT